MNSIHSAQFGHSTADLYQSRVSPTQTGSNSTQAASDQPDTVHLDVSAFREAREEARISYQAANGKLTSDQATQLDAQLSSIEQQISTDEQADGGTLSKQDAFAINQMQNQFSSEIYTAAHTDASSPSPQPVPAPAS